MVDARRRSPAVTERTALDRKTCGNLVESAARDALLRAGLREVASNANYRGGELDLVVRLPQGEFRIPQFRRKRSA